MVTAITTSAAPTPAPPPTGGLDFSSLLNGQNHGSSSSNNNTSSSSGLTFHIPGLNAALAQQQQQQPVQWDGMTLDDAMERNANPATLMTVLFSPRHPNLLKELNYHSPRLAQQLKETPPAQRAEIWRRHTMKGAMQRTLDASQQKGKEREMTTRLRNDPMDEEANKWFGEKIRKENVERSYHEMMESFPESLGRVLMLYIDANVNGHPIQAFVDSGAQSTIMSASAAEKCGLLHLLDDRFAGVAVGVGTGTILGRVHLCPLVVEGRHFPCTITVMDDGGRGLGDKNMEFLFGLDMLKRHRCRIDLAKNVLVFGTTGQEMETPFLHEKDLDESKGGTKGFDADKANKELEERMKERKDGTDDNMDVDQGDDTKKST